LADRSRAPNEWIEKIPDDAQFSTWTLPTDAVWWYFAEPIDMPTTTHELAAYNGHGRLRALSMGWIQTKRKDPFGLIYTEEDFYITCWIDDPTGLDTRYSVTPSQVWYWPKGKTLKQMVERTSREHYHQYGPGGQFHGQHILGHDRFMRVTNWVSRFVLAGLMWLDSKILVTEPVPIGRQFRKSIERKTGRTISDVKVIYLRRRESPQAEKNEDATSTQREYSRRWVVEGHVRNQPVGPGRSERKLIWISPYVKGPEDKPLVVPKTKVYVVNR
jgi:hypothetical protein